MSFATDSLRGSDQSRDQRRTTAQGLGEIRPEQR